MKSWSLTVSELRRNVLLATLFAFTWCTASAQTERPTRIRVNGVELHYIEQGKGVPLILLHGGQGDYRAWQAQMQALSPRYRVISYSRRYHYPNNNPIAGRHYSAIVDAADLAGLIAELKLGRVHLVGTSYGAFAALALAVQRPELVRSLVVAEPPVHRWVTDTERGAALFRDFLTSVQGPAKKAFDAGNDEAAMRVFIDRFDGAGTFDSLPTERRLSVMQNALFFKATVASSDPFPNLPKDKARRLNIPTLVIRGANTDELHRLVSEEVSRVVPQADLMVIPEAGHGSPRQNPAAFNAAVLAFLDGAGQSGRR